MVKGEWIKPGAIVIDCGINHVPGEWAVYNKWGHVCIKMCLLSSWILCPWCLWFTWTSFVCKSVLSSDGNLWQCQSKENTGLKYSPRADQWQFWFYLQRGWWLIEERGGPRNIAAEYPFNLPHQIVKSCRCCHFRAQKREFCCHYFVVGADEAVAFEVQKWQADS